MIKKKDRRGGPRPGSGPKRKLDNPSKHLVNLDEKTIVTLTALGGGNLSAGIRKAAEVVRDKSIDEKYEATIREIAAISRIPSKHLKEPS